MNPIERALKRAEDIQAANAELERLSAASASRACLDAAIHAPHGAHAYTAVTGLGEMTVRWCDGIQEEPEPCCYGYVTSRGQDHEVDCPQARGPA